MQVHPARIKGFLLRTLGVDLRDLVLHRVDVTIPGLHRSLAGLRIAHISDLHCGPKLPCSHLSRVVALVRTESPDLVVLTGDFVDDARYAEGCAEKLALLRPALGSFACLGNHDHLHAPGELTMLLQSAGIRVLRNEHSLIPLDGVQLCIVGVDDVGNYGLWVRRVRPGDDLPRALSGSPLSDTFRMLLVHNPDFVTKPVFARENTFRPIHLVLAGHLHGGQIRLPIIGTPYVPSRCGARFAGGLVEWMGTPMHISRGTGSSVPIRFNCPHEVSILTLKPAF